MDFITARNPLSFPLGDNSSDTVLAGSHFNLTTLKTWNYTYYSNRTLSNGSICVLLFTPFTPFLLSNGTFLNSTSCYSPVEPLKARSKIGLVFACLFAISLVSTVINLRKHAELFFHMEKMFRGNGSRWQWYWMLATAAFAIISSIAGIDVDRYYLSELPIVISSIFWYLMMSATMATVWESVRHWDSWQERQMVDPNAYLLQPCGRRNKAELYLPLAFYFCLWMNFFMIIPRSWTNIEKQRSEDQTNMFAEPTATGLRFKLGSFCLVVCWIIILYSVQDSIKHYKAMGRTNQTVAFVANLPMKFWFSLPLSLVLVGYESACAFDFSFSPLNCNTNLRMVYGLGWAIPFLIILVQSISGYCDPSEDIELPRQRQVRAAEFGQDNVEVSDGTVTIQLG